MTTLKKIIVSLLTSLARIAIARHKPMVVAVVGSVGKTTTKDALKAVLALEGTVRASEKSFNSEIGLPLTILGLPNAWKSPLGWAMNILRGAWVAWGASDFPKTLVLEVGVDRPGDMQQAVSWLSCDAVVLTRLPDRPVHVENFPSPEAVRNEKAEILRALKPGGLVIANADDEYIMALKNKVKNAGFVTYGTAEGAMLRGSLPQVLYELDGDVRVPVGETYRADWRSTSVPVRVMGVLGTQSMTATLAALALGAQRGLNIVDMIQSIETMHFPAGRMRLIPGIHHSMLVDDSYNASPVAVHAALSALQELHSEGRRIALLGDMLELGKYEEEEHRKVGTHAAEFCDLLLAVGKRAAHIAAAAKDAGMKEESVHSFAVARDAGLWLRDRLSPGDLVLIKGSQGSGENTIRMERATKELMLDPETASDLLVRQDVEWGKR